MKGKVCKNCGRPIPPGSKFCEGCGMDVTGTGGKGEGEAKGAALMLTVFFLIAGTDFLCAWKMAAAKNFLTLTQFNTRRVISLLFAIFFFVLYLFLSSPKGISVKDRILRTLTAAAPVAFFASLIELVKNSFTTINIEDTSTRGIMIRAIVLLLLVVAFLIVIFTGVASVSGESRIGFFKALGMLGMHLPLALLWLLGWIAVEVMRTLVDYYALGGFGSRATYFALMGWKLSETVCAAVITGILLTSMQRAVNKWDVKIRRKKEKKREKKGNAKRAEKVRSSSTLPALILSAVLLVAACIIVVAGGHEKKTDTSEAIVQDIQNMVYLTSADMIKGNIATSVISLGEIRDRIDAWKYYASGDTREIERILQRRKDDPMIWKIYLSLSEDGLEKLENYAIAEGVGDDAVREVLFEAYAGLKDREISDVREDYQREMLNTYLGRGHYVSNLTELVKQGKEAERLAKKLEESFAVLDAYYEMITLFDSMGRNGAVEYGMMSDALNIAQEYPDDATIQYMAADIVASGAGDGREGLYDEAIECVDRFLTISEKTRGIGDDEILARQQLAIRILIPLQGFEEIIALIDRMDVDEEMEESYDSLRLYCLMRGEESGDTYAAAEQMVRSGTDNPQVWYFYGLGALEEGDTPKTIEAIERYCRRGKNRERFIKRFRVLYGCKRHLYAEYEYGK